jgi:hypothetical protein
MAVFVDYQFLLFYFTSPLGQGRGLPANHGAL